MPSTVNVPSLPLTVPTVTFPLPQLIVATKCPALVVAFASVKVATGPVNDESPRQAQDQETGPRGRQAEHRVWRSRSSSRARLPALDTARTR